MASITNTVSMTETDAVGKHVLKENNDSKTCGSYVGKCKWFSDQLGYGFILVMSGDKKGNEVFVHYTGICPVNSKTSFRTLVCGEYVSFDIVQGAKDLQAVHVLGINGGPLLCDSNTNIKSIKPRSNHVTQDPPSIEVPEDRDTTAKDDRVGEYVGRCKWFNDVSGYGFVVIASGDKVGKDVFVHYTGLKSLGQSQKSHRTLVDGEYISFDIVQGTKDLQAVNVTGYGGGSLLCDENHIPKSGTRLPLTKKPFGQKPQ